jgi:hypothetical protein
VCVSPLSGSQNLFLDFRGENSIWGGAPAIVSILITKTPPSISKGQSEFRCPYPLIASPSLLPGMPLFQASRYPTRFMEYCWLTSGMPNCKATTQSAGSLFQCSKLISFLHPVDLFDNHAQTQRRHQDLLKWKSVHGGKKRRPAHSPFP